MPPLDLTICPRCKQKAPLIYRGAMSYCTACGAPRVPLGASSVNLAGKPSKVGGVIARVFGWIVLVGGLFVALALYALLAWIFPGAPASWIVSAPIAAMSLLFGFLFVRGGKTLQNSGSREERKTRMNAIYALAAYRNGTLTAADAASAADLTVEAADRLLTEVAKDEPDYVQVDLDDAGGIRYRFPTVTSVGDKDWQKRIDEANVRVSAEPQPIDPRDELAREEASAEDAARRQKR